MKAVLIHWVVEASTTHTGCVSGLA